MSSGLWSGRQSWFDSFPFAPFPGNGSHLLGPGRRQEPGQWSLTTERRLTAAPAVGVRLPAQTLAGAQPPHYPLLDSSSLLHSSERCTIPLSESARQGQFRTVHG